MKTQKGIREHEADELRKAKRLEPMRKSGKERHSLYRSIDEEEEEEEGTVDMNEYMKNVQAMRQQMMQNMQQMIQGNGMQNYLQQVQVLQQQLASGQISAEEYTAKVQQLAAQNFGN